MQIAGVEMICDPSVRLREDGVLAANTPVTRERPLIERE